MLRNRKLHCQIKLNFQQHFSLTFDLQRNYSLAPLCYLFFSDGKYNFIDLPSIFPIFLIYFIAVNGSIVFKFESSAELLCKSLRRLKMCILCKVPEIHFGDFTCLHTFANDDMLENSTIIKMTIMMLCCNCRWLWRDDSQR